MSPYRSERGVSWRAKVARALVVGLALTACSTTSGPGLAVRGKEVNVVFGVQNRPLIRTTPKAVRGPVPAAPVREDGGYAPLPELPDIELPPLLPRGSITVETCPDALENAVVTKRADANIPYRTRPAAGTTAWKVTGTVDGKPLQRSMEERQLADVKEALNTPDNTGVNEDPAESGQAFTWSTAEPEAGGGYVRSTYAVKSLSRIPTRNVQIVAPVGAPVGPQPPTQPPYVHEESVGSPDRGIVLTSVERFDAQGASISRFAPPVGLLLLPLPVTGGTKFTSRTGDATSTDPVLVYSAQVTGRQVYDACGELVQGWTVKGVLTSDPATLSEGEREGNPYDVTFAPQYGGLVIAERRVEQVDGKVYDRTFSIGAVPQTATAG